jgi:RNA polymerase sigma factor (sigma-70 family)
MADGRVSDFLRQLGGGALARDGGALSDGQLLERFLRDRDGPAFEALLRRHGPMVFGVCRRVVRRTHDAEDAFQATFLALVHKAASVFPRELVGHWLYGVAYRTALNARRLAARRGAREIQVDKMPEREVVQPEPAPDLRPLLDQELSRLPEVYRVPVVLCDLGGKPRQEVARQLSVPEGTVSSRLARGRELLRKRLARRGLMLTGAALVPALADAAQAAVPAPMFRATLEAGMSVAAGGAVSAPVACLLRATLREMVVAKFRAAAVVLLAVGLVGLAAGLAVRQAWPQDPQNPPDESPVVALAPAPAPRVEDRRPPEFVRVADPKLEEGLALSEFVTVNGALYFVASRSSDNNGQLWKCVPAADGVKTTRLTDIPEGVRRGSAPFQVTNVNGTLFFVSHDKARGTELWKSDGTPDGTAPVMDIKRGGAFDAPRDPGALPDVGGLMVAGKTLFFTRIDENREVGLYKSDGTAAGTVLVKKVNPWPATASTARRAWADVNGTLYFAAWDPHGNALWKSDGTAEGTVLVKNIGGNPYTSTPCFLTNVNGTLFFTADDGVHGRELWKSDGTAAGTVMVKDINPGRAGGFPDPWMGNLTNVNGTLFFAAEDGVHGLELWKSDGTEEGTVMVKDINPGPASSVEWRRPGDTAPPGLGKPRHPGNTVQRHGLDPGTMAAVNGTLFFVADDGAHGYELWKSDGTEKGTVLVKDIAPGDKTADPSCLTNINGTLFFVAGDGARYRQLWKSDGTEKGTVPVKDPTLDGGKPSPNGEVVERLTAVGGGVFFTVPRAGPDVPSRIRGSPELWYMPAPRHRRD